MHRRDFLWGGIALSGTKFAMLSGKFFAPYDIIAGPGTSYPTLAAALAAVPPGGSIGIRDGTYAAAQVPASAGNCTIAAINRRQAIIDGSTLPLGSQRGLDVLVPTTGTRQVTLRGLCFRNAGVASSADGEAGLYFRGNTGGLVIDCQFDNNQNGLFSVAGAAAITCQRCEWGLLTSNGQSQDGRSHDVYSEGVSYTEIDCYHYGNIWGHSLKSRSPVNAVTRGVYTSLGGRAIEITDGGSLACAGSYLSGLSSTVSYNILAYADENDGAPNGTAGPVTFDGCTFVAVRPNQIIMFGHGGAMTFTNTTQVWVDDGVHGTPTIVLGLPDWGGTMGTVTGIALTPGGATTVSSIPPVPTLA